MASTRPLGAVRARAADGDDALEDGGGDGEGKHVYRREQRPATGKDAVYSTKKGKQLSTTPKQLL